MGKERICPRCEEKVPEGYLYCPRCLAEVPWVKEYNTVETLIEKNKKNQETVEEEEVQESFDSTYTFGKKHIAFLVVFAFVILLGASVVMLYMHTHTYEYLYASAGKAYVTGDYEKALNDMTDALVKNSEDKEGNLLLASIFEAMGDQESALLILKPLLSQYPEDGALFKRYLDLLYEENRTEEIKEWMDQCTDSKIRKLCEEYICQPPEINLPSGVYTSLQRIILTAEYDEIYYSIGNVSPLNLYTGEFFLPEGTHTLSVVGVNEKGISSDIVSVEYTISLSAPDAPEVFPESGTYDKVTKIEIEVPKGCKAYYAFDKDPKEMGIEYNAPVNMPQGAHTFMAVIIGANGKASEITSRDYYLEY